MKEPVKCKCAVCVIERLLLISVEEALGAERFLRLVASSPVLATFTDPSALIHHLHDQRDGEYYPPSVSEVVGALIQTGPAIRDPEMSQSVLVLAFIPAIHRTYRETCARFQEISTDDIAQQTLLFFLELAASASLGLLNGQLSFGLARSLRRNTFRWARREQLMLMDRGRFAEERAKETEPHEDACFESISLLEDFLDYSVQAGILSKFEHDLLLKVKVDGFGAKEVLDRNTVLSPKAVHVRIQRIMARLQDAARGFSSPNGNPTIPLKSEKSKKGKIFQKV